MRPPRLPQDRLTAGLCTVCWMLCALSALAGSHSRPHKSLTKAGPTSQSEEKAADETPACGCPDGRSFAVGSSLYGRSSARVLVSAFRTETSGDSSRGELPRCSGISVTGQIVQLLHAGDGRPYLARKTLKRGTIASICSTKIRFAAQQKSYDFFSDDGNAVTLSENGTAAPGDSKEQTADDAGSTNESETEASDEGNSDLTGKDLLTMIPTRSALGDPGRSGFNEEDLKEGAYVILRKRTKATVADDDDGTGLTRASNRNRPSEINVSAGTLGRIEKAGRVRSDPEWVVQIMPDSAPRPFWRSVVAISHGGFNEPQLPHKVALPSSAVVEINHFLDQYGTDWTRFGENATGEERGPDPGTTNLQGIYSPAPVSLEENLATATKAGMLSAIERESLGLQLVAKDSDLLLRDRLLVLGQDTAGKLQADIAPDLLQKQCFVGLNAWRPKPLASTATAPFRVTDVDVRVFQPEKMPGISPDYYAIDLKFVLQRDGGTGRLPVVCRFPSASIDLELLQTAEEILSAEFKVHSPKAR